MDRRISGLLAGVGLCVATPALAQTATDRTAGVYVWADTSYQSVGIAPVEDFGFRALLASGPAGNERHSSHLQGYGLSGGIGYVFADGELSPALGSNVRIELAGRYVDASGASSAESAPATNVNIIAYALSGAAVGLAGCGGVTCFTRSSLDTDYSAISAGLRGKSDFDFGAWTLSPSLGLTASGGKLSHSFTQALFANGAPYPVLPPNLMQFDMSAEIDWSDYGLELGGAATYAVSQKLLLGLKGSLGLVGRSASASASSGVYFGSSVPAKSAVDDGTRQLSPWPIWRRTPRCG